MVREGVGVGVNVGWEEGVRVWEGRWDVEVVGGGGSGEGASGVDGVKESGRVSGRDTKGCKHEA